MSKGSESKDSGRRRRGGLRVPSDKVPRRASSEPAVAPPIPEPVGLAASVSESFGVSEGALDTGAELDQDEIQTMVSDAPARAGGGRLDTMDDAEDDARDQSVDAELLTTQVSSLTPAAQDTALGGDRNDGPSDDLDISLDDDASEEEIEDSMVTGEIEEIDSEVDALGAVATDEDLPIPEDSEEDREDSGTGESVDIPFDDNEETTVTAAIPESPSEIEAQPVVAAPSAPVINEKPKQGDDAAGGKKKPRFTRALTMALSESDLEEVRTDPKAPSPAPREMASSSETASAPTDEVASADSGDVLADDEIEEIPEVTAPPPTKPATDLSDAAPAAKPKRADTVEPPPPPPPVAQPTPAPKPVAKPAPAAAAVDEKKRRRAKPWFEEIFDEDYLRTLPFLTPQATQFEANFVMESLGVEAGAQVLDVGCGYGRHAMELAARGYHVVGLDSSLPLLLRGADEAQRRGLTINFVHGDMREMTFESQFDGAYCLFSSFGYFDDETNKRTAQNIAKALKPGARFVVEVLNRDYLVADLPSRVWWEGDGCVVLEEVEFNYFSSRIVSNRSVVFDDGRQLEHEISLRSFSLHELGKFLHAVGFRVLEISGSMSTRGRFFGAHSRDIVVVAERRATQPDES